MTDIINCALLHRALNLGSTMSVVARTLSFLARSSGVRKLGFMP